MEGNTEILNQNKNHLENQLTPNNNTVLHISAQFGHIQCVMEILNIFPSMYRRLENGVGMAKDMMRMSNEAKDTALHEAVRNHHPIAVQLLTQEDPEFCHPANNAEETPLYLAAERGYVGLVFVILETCTVPVYGCTRKLLQWKPALSKEADAYGWTLLHYAARFGYVLRAKDVLNADKSVAYITDKDDKNTALHLAASQGHVCVIAELIAHCMDCWEMVDGRGQNILLIAVKNQKKRAIKFILQKFPLSSLINQKDVDRNTPLHLLAASDCYKAGLVKHPKADMMAFNNASLTPLDVVCSKTQFGRLQCVEEILNECPVLLRRVNNKCETPLHFAVREERLDVAKALIDCVKELDRELESGGGAAKEILRATNEDKDIALHVAVWNEHLNLVKLLIGEDPEFQHPANNVHETPLYLATEIGCDDVVSAILGTCTSPTYGGPGGRTALHAAALIKNRFSVLINVQKKNRSMRRLLEWKQDLIKEADEYGWTPL
ncbi:Ankyrin repeat-containing protein [Camellia lanceoleosa]|uniref:Ankyrin repeat-containing protein n=1 Tax=Camellia lanceoleosa TaxID=1840588 RepID=A0ACC0GNJ6_9ERIC|nr:Ankyrin repeat-containing protein [Camellia lanceoleosa]